MPTRKKNAKKRSQSTSKKKAATKNKLATVEIPVLTRKAPHETPPESNDVMDIDHNQEIRELVSIAVNESVPQIIDTIMAKLMQPIGTDPKSSD